MEEEKKIVIFAEKEYFLSQQLSVALHYCNVFTAFQYAIRYANLISALL